MAPLHPTRLAIDRTAAKAGESRPGAWPVDINRLTAAPRMISPRDFELMVTEGGRESCTGRVRSQPVDQHICEYTKNIECRQHEERYVLAFAWLVAASRRTGSGESILSSGRWGNSRRCVARVQRIRCSENDSAAPCSMQAE